MTNPLGTSQLATATAAKTSGVVPVTMDGRSFTAQCARGLTPAAGDVLVLTKVGAGNRPQWFAIAIAFTAAPAEVESAGEAPPPVYPVAAGTLTVAPTFTGTYRDAAWLTGSTDVEQGVYGGAGNATGAAFYGMKPQALAGATVTAAHVAVQRLPAGDPTTQTATLRLMTEATWTGAAPTLTSSTAGPALAAGASTSFVVPTAWAQSIVDGTAGGLAVLDGDGVPFMRFAGRGQTAAAWLLSIDWTR